MPVTMRKFSILIFCSILLIFQSCKSHDPVPDYASKLEGDFDIGYLIANLNTKEVVIAKLGEPTYAKINLKRKSNQYLTATVMIDDSTTKFTDTFELVVSESEDQKEAYGKTGFLTNYKVGTVRGNGIFYNNWSLYEDGTIIGLIQSNDDKSIQRFALGNDFD